VRFVFGVAAASRNTRFQAARYDLTWAGLAPADRASFCWRLLSFDHLVLAAVKNHTFFGDGRAKGGLGEMPSAAVSPIGEKCKASTDTSAPGLGAPVDRRASRARDFFTRADRVGKNRLLA
jgi:hypothetical protein